MNHETERELHRENAEAALERAHEAMRDENSESLLAYLDQALAHLNSMSAAEIG